VDGERLDERRLTQRDELCGGNLVNGATYVFRIRAHNEAGWGPASVTVSAVPRTVPSAPLECEVFQFGSDPHRIVVQWKPAVNDGGESIDFDEVQVLQDGDLVTLEVTDSGFVGMYLYYGIYEVRVRSWNDAGPGPWCITGIWHLEW
jgi:hypothetical protein